MSTNSIIPIIQEGYQSQKRAITDQNAIHPSFEQNPDSVTSYSDICEPIVEIVSESGDLSKPVSESVLAPAADGFNCDSYTKTHACPNKNDLSDANSKMTVKEKEKYVFVLMNNVAPTTAESSALRILDIKSAVSASSVSIDNSTLENESFTVENVSFPVDKVQKIITEVIENMPGKRNVDLNNCGVNNEFFLVLNCSIPFNVKDDTANNTFRVPAPLKINHSTYDTRSRPQDSAVTVEKFKEGHEKQYLIDSGVEREEEISSVQRYKDERDDCYILVVDNDNDDPDVKTFGQRDDFLKMEEVYSDISTFSQSNDDNNEEDENDINEFTANEKVIILDGQKQITTEVTACGERYVSCANCKTVFKNSKSLKQHLQSVCNKNKSADCEPKHVCDVCGKVFTHADNFQAHMDAHNDLREFSCSECDSSFNKRWFLSRHVAQVHGKSRYTYFCSGCGLKSTSKEHIEMHERTHSMPEGAEAPRPFVCVCGKAFISKHALRCHARTGHKSDTAGTEPRSPAPAAASGPLSCEVCGRECKSKSALISHRWYYHSPGRRARVAIPVSCDLCDKTFAHMTSLSAHRHRYHKPRDPDKLRCRVCGKVFKDDGGLWAHEKYMHKDGPVFPCYVCGTSFKRKGDHRRHMKDKHNVLKTDQFDEYEPIETTQEEFEIDEASIEIITVDFPMELDSNQ